MKKIFRKLFLWLYKEEIEKIEKLTKQSNDNICEVRNFIRFVKADVGVDVHINSPSWAVFCIQGKKQDFVKLVQYTCRISPTVNSNFFRISCYHPIWTTIIV